MGDGSMSMRFYLLDLDSMHFEGMVAADGPHIKQMGGVSIPIGEASLHFGDPISPGWRLHGPHSTLDLPTLDKEQVLALAAHFGLPIRTSPAEPPSGGDFLRSPAFAGLCHWVRRHPDKAKKIYQGAHQRTPGWLDVCNAANALDDEA